ncbi:MAG: hypothetical protein RLO48_12175 [Bauldia litoralis]
MSQDQAFETAEPVLEPGVVVGRKPSMLDRALILSGFIFCAASATAMVYGLYLIVSSPVGSRPVATNFPGFLSLYGDLLAVAFFAMVAAFLAFSFFRHAGKSTNFVIRPEDREYLWPLLTKPNSEAVDQYIRLASLSGFSGSFTKVGFTGLPLATVALTLIFVILSLLTDNTDLMELAKLTLGAFIGSFVQRQVERGERQGPAGAASSRESAPRLPV